MTIWVLFLCMAQTQRCQPVQMHMVDATHWAPGAENKTKQQCERGAAFYRSRNAPKKGWQWVCLSQRVDTWSTN